MTFANVLLICTGGIAICAALVFLVETLVAFFLHEEEHFVHPKAPVLRLESTARQVPSDKAA